MVYSEVYDGGLPYEMIERSNERITVKVRYPLGMDEPASETWTIVKRNGEWKMSELPKYATADEDPFNLTVAEAEKYLIGAYEDIYSYEKYRQYVQRISYKKTDRKGHYEFSIETNVEDYYVSIDPKTAIIEEW